MLFFDHTALRDVRRTRHLKQSDVAKLIDCTPATIAGYENGNIKISASRLAELIELYQVDPSKLFITRY